MLSRSLFLLSLAAVFTWAADPEASTGNEPRRVTLRGHIVELHAEINKSHGLDLKNRVGSIWAFKTVKGEIVTLLKTRRSLALFMDERLRQRELIIKGRQFPNSQAVEATFIQSVHEGIVHDLYYYCEICSIKALTPEICACCREPVRLVEEPLKTNLDGEPAQ